jgi:hypothetical protein
MVVFQKVARNMGAVKVTSLESGADTCQRAISQFADADFTAICEAAFAKSGLIQVRLGLSFGLSGLWADNHRIGRSPTGFFA